MDNECLDFPLLILGVLLFKLLEHLAMEVINMYIPVTYTVSVYLDEASTVDENIRTHPVQCHELCPIL